MLSTAFALAAFVFACIAAVAAWLAQRSERALHAAERDLRAAERRLNTAADHVIALDGRVKTLAGRVYAQSRKSPPSDADDGEDITARGADRSYAGQMQLDPDLEAELRLQSAPPISPGKRS